MKNILIEELTKQFNKIVFDDKMSLDEKAQKIQDYWKKLKGFGYQIEHTKKQIKTYQSRYLANGENCENPLSQITGKIATAYLRLEAEEISKKWKTDKAEPKQIDFGKVELQIGINPFPDDVDGFIRVGKELVEGVQKSKGETKQEDFEVEEIKYDYSKHIPYFLMGISVGGIVNILLMNAGIL